MNVPRGIWALSIFLLAAVLAVWLYLHRNPEWPRPLDDFEVTEAWLQCIDCQEGFFERVGRVAPANRDSVTRLLSDALKNGPDAAQRSRFDRDLMRTWVADSLHRRSRGETSTYQLGQYLARYRRGFEVTWRRRAALALGAIRGDSALAALDLTLNQLPLNDAVDSALHRTVQRARKDSVIFAP